MSKRFLNNLGLWLGLVLFVVALWVLHRELREVHYHDVIRQALELPHGRVVLSLLLTLLNYLVLTGYEILAFRSIQHPLKYGKITLASFIGYAFSNNVGLSMISGSSIRYRLYTAWGLSAWEILKVITLITLTFWLGLCATAGVVFLWEPVAIPTALHLPFASLRPVGALLLLLVAGYLVWIAVGRKPLKIFSWEVALPSFRMSVAQIAVSSLDAVLAGAALFVLLPSVPGLSFPEFLGIYLLAMVGGAASQVPGGLGVFETMVVVLLGPAVPASHALGALLVYRGIYYILPLIVASVLLGAHEIAQRKESFRWVADVFGEWVPGLVPNVLAFMTFVGGSLLLLSGATPAVHSRLAWLNDFLPLPVIEASHLLGSLVGMGLLLLAIGLQRRLDAAYLLSIMLLGAGIVLSLLKAFDYEKAAALTVMLAALLPCRAEFHRKASFITERFSPGWIAAILFAFVASVWLGLFSYKHVEYSHDLWWRFTLTGDAPRFLRATVGAVAVALFFAITRLLRPAAPESMPAGPAELERARPVVLASPRASARLALLGDKAFHFSAGGNAFIMYGVEGRSWVALGDPVGPEEEWNELIWEFRERCDQYNGWIVFYDVGKEHLPLYLDQGLALLKIGEEACVRLADFSLEGGSRRGLRYTLHHVEKEGCTFEVVGSERIPALLPELQQISDAWLTEKNTREKSFSLGSFNPGYLKEFPFGMVRKGGRIVAFANLWLAAEKEEVSIDLMRHLPEAPSDVMEYLFVQLMLWGKQQGYGWFNLGVAPLSGLEDRALAPLWTRLGAMVFRHGEHFYNFQGLRQYKEKFDPEWQPRYLASPGGLVLPRVLTDLASLISGGLKGVITK